MTREEREQAARTLQEFYDFNKTLTPQGDSWLQADIIINRYTQEELGKALPTAIAGLRGPQPDPDTGLVPCGCGCAPELRDEYRGWYQVYCTGCDMHGGNSHTPDGVIEEWNTAMGYTAPSRPDAGEMAPNGDEGAES